MVDLTNAPKSTPAEAREDGELQLISRMEAVLRALDGPLSLAAGNPFRGLLEEKSARGVGEDVEPPKKVGGYRLR